VNYNLYQNQPNPFSAYTRIEYSIPGECFVELKVYDILGKEVANLVNELKSPDNHTCFFNAEQLPGGIYFYVLKAEDFVDVKKMMVIKN
jgi:hypothetical protein